MPSVGAGLFLFFLFLLQHLFVDDDFPFLIFLEEEQHLSFVAETEATAEYQICWHTWQVFRLFCFSFHVIQCLNA